MIANSWYGCQTRICSTFLTAVPDLPRAMLHDEEVYPDPFSFNPDRFMKDGKLDPSVRDPGHACWGFGRR